MDFDFSPAEQAFADEVDAWLVENHDPVVMDHHRENFTQLSDTPERRAFMKKLAAKGWLGMSWPKEYGGKEIEGVYEYILNEALSKHAAPQIGKGVGIIGKTLIRHGSDKLKLLKVGKEDLEAVAALHETGQVPNGADDKRVREISKILSDELNRTHQLSMEKDQIGTAKWEPNYYPRTGVAADALPPKPIPRGEKLLPLDVVAKHRAASLSKERNVDPASMGEALFPPGIARFDWNDEAVVRACIPAANGMFDARSLARMYAMLANGGSLHGVRLIDPAIARRAGTIESRRRDQVLPMPMQWRLGYHRVLAIGASVPHGFGHFGFGGSGAFCDPSRELAVALVLNHGVGTPFGDVRMWGLSAAAIHAADHRRRRG